MRGLVPCQRRSESDPVDGEGGWHPQSDRGSARCLRPAPAARSATAPRAPSPRSCCARPRNKPFAAASSPGASSAMSRPPSSRSEVFQHDHPQVRLARGLQAGTRAAPAVVRQHRRRTCAQAPTPRLRSLSRPRRWYPRGRDSSRDRGAGWETQLVAKLPEELRGSCSTISSCTTTPSDTIRGSVAGVSARRHPPGTTMGWVVASSAARNSVDGSTTIIARSRGASLGVWGHYETRRDSPRERTSWS